MLAAMNTHPGTSPARSFFQRLRPVRGHLWALVVLLASLASVFALWRIAYDRELRASETAFVAGTGDIAALLQQRMVNYELVAGGGISLFASVARPTPQQWYGYVDGMQLQRRFPSILGLGFAGYLRQSRLDDLQQEWRQAGWGDLSVRPKGERENLGVILYLEPQTSANRSAIGYDMFSEPMRRAAMTRAMETGEPTLSGAVHLVQDGAKQETGLLLYVPVYRDGNRPDTLADRRESLLGWVHVPFRIEKFVAEVLGDRKARFRIFDVTAGRSELLFTRQETAAVQPPAFHNATEFDNYGRRWRMEFDSPPLAEAVPRLGNLQNILALGLFASLLMYAIAWMLARTESRAHAIALRLTEDYRHSEERFRTAMEYSAIGKAIFDSKGRIVEANASLGKIVGLAPTSLAGQPFDALFEDGESAAHAREPAQPGDAEGVRRETRRLHRKDGEPRHVQLTYAPMPGSVGGEDIAGLVQVEDVTARLRAEAKVRALNRTLEARVTSRTRELSLANQELEAFAYSVSHDLRAPLRAIDGFSKILAERYADKLDESGQNYLTRVRSAAGRMGELIDALLKMSRVSRGALKREPIDLGRMAGEITEELRAGDRERVNQVEVDIAPDLQAEGDPSLLRNLLGNLLGNAWKFTANQVHARIEFGCADGEFFIRDNGAGFSQDYVHKLFRPFQRLHAQSAFDGHGIGLASAKRIVERHGGTIRAEGREGEGAVFYFTLPGDWEHDAD